MRHFDSYDAFKVKFIWYESRGGQWYVIRETDYKKAKKLNQEVAERFMESTS
jgi:hypothetical protein